MRVMDYMLGMRHIGRRCLCDSSRRVCVQVVACMVVTQYIRRMHLCVHVMGYMDYMLEVRYIGGRCLCVQTMDYMLGCRTCAGWAPVQG